MDDEIRICFEDLRNALKEGDPHAILLRIDKILYPKFPKEHPMRSKLTYVYVCMNEHGGAIHGECKGKCKGSGFLPVFDLIFKVKHISVTKNRLTPAIKSNLKHIRESMSVTSPESIELAWKRIQDFITTNFPVTDPDYEDYKSALDKAVEIMNY